VEKAGCRKIGKYIRDIPWKNISRQRKIREKSK
jgi:hypothetical protein